MKFRLTAALFAIVALTVVARAENTPPRDIWPQATTAASAGDVNGAIKATNDLVGTGHSYGIATFPIYAHSAAALARQADKQGKKEVADWASKAADQLDPKSPAVAFSNADRFRDQGNWARALNAAVTGFTRIWNGNRTRLLSRADLLIAIILTLALTAALFALALFARYGRSAAHDFREILSQRFRGGSVSVLGFALMFLPIIIWLGPMWLVLYWFIIFFGYAGKFERVLIVLLALIIATLPIALDRVAAWVGGVENPIIIAAISTNEQAYQPEALRRMQDLAALVPDNPIVQLLLGNLQLQEGNEQQAQIHYRRSMELRESAGAHVNLGNLHFLQRCLDDHL